MMSARHSPASSFPPSRFRSINRCASIDRIQGYKLSLAAQPSFLPAHRGRLNMRVALVAATMVLSRVLVAQAAAEHIALGDKEFEAMNAAGALAHYQAAIGIDSNNTEALWKASVQAIDLGEFNDAGRDSLYRVGEQYARRALQSNAQSSMAHFALAKAIGRRALSLGPRDRVKYAGEVRKEALAALQL